MGQKKIADLLVEVLAEAGVQPNDGVPGDSLNGVADSIRAKTLNIPDRALSTPAGRR
jgi:thiamine pyrophosphate-dependent acetolactate synthase large subunit-like protein